MIVVSNTSPLTSLAAIGHFDLLRKVFGEIHIAHGVWQELNKGDQRHPGSHEVENASWIHRHEIESETVPTLLRRDLDLGEAETLALALELKADLVLPTNRKAVMRRSASVSCPLESWAFCSKPSGKGMLRRSAHCSMRCGIRLGFSWETSCTGSSWRKRARRFSRLRHPPA
jgi:predicted nucleic acid-binding protein